MVNHFHPWKTNGWILPQNDGIMEDWYLSGFQKTKKTMAIYPCWGVQFVRFQGCSIPHTGFSGHPEIQQTQLTRWLGDMYLVEIPCNLPRVYNHHPRPGGWEFPWDFWLPSMPASSQAWWVAFRAWEVGIRRDPHSSSAVPMARAFSWQMVVTLLGGVGWVKLKGWWCEKRLWNHFFCGWYFLIN